MKNIILELSFYENKNDGNQCATITLQIATKYFLGKTPTLDEIDKLVGRATGKWTWNEQIIAGADKLGLKAKYFSTDNIANILQGEKYLRQKFGKSADKIISKINLNEVMDSTQFVIKNNLFEKKALTLKEIENHILKGHIVIVPVDWNKISGKKGIYQGHMLILTSFDEENIFAHNSGPTKPERNMKIKKELFLKAWNVPEISNDIIIVYGKK
ncbi:MAG: hypothetical protein HOE11_04945 [Candidatus Diapherotrites archaeon]|jgi:hypothetical protein|nr:hypothetical protein [Candidatus Diapherotrites archaeon]MBT4597298.1 hypothetical protein [Candidatus Diapherotrites archaeon]